MARDIGPRPQQRPAQPNTTADEFWESEEGQWIDQQSQRLENNETTFEEVQKEYAKKFGAPDYSQAGKPKPQFTVPVTPLSPKVR